MGLKGVYLGMKTIPPFLSNEPQELNNGIMKPRVVGAGPPLFFCHTQSKKKVLSREQKLTLCLRLPRLQAYERINFCTFQMTQDQVFIYSHTKWTQTQVELMWDVLMYAANMC